MVRDVIVLHRDGDGSHQVAFLWSTQKMGTLHEVLQYLIHKFQHPADFPAGYKSRTITTGDRITIVSQTRLGLRSVATYELATPTSYRRL